MAVFELPHNNEPHTFSKQDLININVVSKMEELKQSIYPYYLPCKAKIYLEDLNENKCITILRQILKLYQMKLESKQKYIKYKKTTVYYISKYNTNTNHMKVELQNSTLEFE
jgi:hypothetical protein